MSAAKRATAVVRVWGRRSRVARADIRVVKQTPNRIRKQPRTAEQLRNNLLSDSPPWHLAKSRPPPKNLWKPEDAGLFSQAFPLSAMAETSSASSFLLGNYARFDLTIVRGRGSRVWDDEGKEYLDFGAGIAVCSLGHVHPALTEALVDQAGELLHCSNLYRSPAQERYARALSEQVVGHPGKSVFVNSGAEANETLLKFARRFGVLSPQSDGTPRYGILTFLQSFHGRTFGGISATGQAKIHDGFGPLLLRLLASSLQRPRRTRGRCRRQHGGHSSRACSRGGRDPRRHAGVSANSFRAG